jgi:hypothetical protein
VVGIAIAIGIGIGIGIDPGSQKLEWGRWNPTRYPHFWHSQSSRVGCAHHWGTRSAKHTLPNYGYQLSAVSYQPETNWAVPVLLKAES